MRPETNRRILHVAGGKSGLRSEQVKELHAKIGELGVANDFLARKLKPWGVT